MRNVELARLQFWSALILMLMAVVIGAKVLLPEWQTYRQGQTVIAQPNAQAESLYLRDIPLASSKQPGWWQTAVMAPMRQAAQKTQVDINPLTGNPGKFETVKTLPNPFHQVETEVQVSGSYTSLLNFLVTLKRQLPSAEIQTLGLTRITDVAKASQPIWNMKIALKILVVTS